MWFLYMVQCSDNSFYTGITNNVEERLKRHNSGNGSKYVRSKRPVVLLYTEQFETRSQALKREIEIKKFSAVNKQHLIRYGLGQKFPRPRLSPQ